MGKTEEIIYASRIKVQGLVQGVGFRPYVYRLASRMGYHGWVENSTDGVLILLQENGAAIEEFVKTLKNEATAASDIEYICIEPVSFAPLHSFETITHRQTAVASCVSFGEDLEPIGLVAQCPSCQGFEIKIVKGRELYVKSLEAE